MDIENTKNTLKYNEESQRLLIKMSNHRRNSTCKTPSHPKTRSWESKRKYQKIPTGSAVWWSTPKDGLQTWWQYCDELKRHTFIPLHRKSKPCRNYCYSRPIEVVKLKTRARCKYRIWFLSYLHIYRKGKRYKFHTNHIVQCNYLHD